MTEYLIEYPYKTTPYRHQHDCFMIGRDRAVHALFMEMGCGKSKVAIDTIAYLYRLRKIKSAVIIAPKGVYHNWSGNEIKVHMPECVDYDLATWTSAPRKDDILALDRLLQDSKRLKIFVVNVEAISSDSALGYLRKFLGKYRPAIGILDESTTIKNPKAQRTKTVLKVARALQYRRILTGNPIPNGPLDLWSQVAFLDASLLGHANYFSYKSAYAVMVQRTFGKRSFQQVVGFRDLNKLQDKMREFSFIVKKEDCLDLPPKIYQGIEVKMSDEQEALYARMLNDSLILLDGLGAQVTATIVITQLLRLHQIVCGFVKPDGMSPIPINKVPMLDQLMETLEEVDGKAIIWATYVYNIEQIARRLAEKYGKDAYVTYYGATSDDDRKEAIRRFQGDPECRFFLSNPDTGGYGLTLTAANTAIYYSTTYDFGKREQSEDRCHRIGTIRAVNYIDFIVPGTVSNKILKVLRNKRTMTADFVSSNWRWLLERDDRET